MGNFQKVNEYVLAGMCVSVFGCVVKHLKKSQVVLVVKNPPANAGDIRDGGFSP